MEILKYALVCIASYLCGSFNTSIFISKTLYGVDVRNYGSGNAFATNTLRTLGANRAIAELLGEKIRDIKIVLMAKYDGICYLT